MSDITVGSVSVDVVPDVSNFRKDLSAKLRGITADIGITADTSRLRAQLDEAARTRVATIDVNADTGAATARIDEAARDRTANVRVDSSGLSEVGSGMSFAASRMSLITGAVSTLGPALIPVTAAVAGLAGALAGPLAIAGAGGGIFGAVSLGAIVKATKDAKQLTDLNKKAQAAQAQADVATTAATRQKYQIEAAGFRAQAAQAKANLAPGEAGLLAAKGSVALGFNALLNKAGKDVFGPMAQGLELLGKILPRLAPIVSAFGQAISGIITGISKWSDSASFKGFVSFVATTGVRTFGTLLSIAKNVAAGVGGMVAAFLPLGTTVLSSFDGLTKRFADFGRSASTNKGFQSFLAYVKGVGPVVATTVGHIFEALGKIAVVLAPLGGVVLGLVDALASFIANAKPGVLAAIAAGIGAIGIAIAIATGGFTLIVPAIAAVAAGIAYAYAHFKPFHDAVDGFGKIAVSAFRSVKTAISGAFDGLSSGGGASGLLSTLQSAGSTITKDFLPVLKTMGTTFTTSILPALKSLGSYLAANVLPIFARLGSIIGTQVIPIVASLARFLYGVLYPAIFKLATQIGGSLKPVFDALFKVIKTDVLPGINQLLSRFREWQPAIQKVVVVVLAVVGALLRLTAAILGKVLPPLITLAGFLIRVLFAAFVKIIDVVAAIVVALTPVFRFILRGFATVTSAIAATLRALGHIPGFGWAKDAADAMYAAAAGARKLADDINNIPSNKDVKVKLRYSNNSGIGSAGGVAGYGVPRRARGGPVVAGRPYIVGEHNAELFIPDQSGRIVPKVPAAVAGGNTYHTTVVADDPWAWKREMDHMTRAEALGGADFRA